MSLSRWLLLEADRNHLALGLAGLAFALAAALGLAGVLELARPDAVDTLAGGLVPGLFAFLSIVLAINQLVLSQELGSADQVRERVERVRAFRQDVEQAAGQAPSPVLPTAFLRLIVSTIEAKADELGARGGAEQDSPEDVRSFAESLAQRASRARAHLTDSRAGRVGAILAVLEYPDADQLHEARRLVAEHGEAMPGSARRVLDEIVEVLAMFSVARTHFRTNYTQQVLARLSRLLLYVGVPAIGAAFALSLLPAALDPTARVVVASALLATAFAPVALLTSYVLRISTVSEHTLAAGPFRSLPD